MKSAEHNLFYILHSQFYIRFVRWAFHRFYHEFAWTYDAVAALVSGGNWVAWVRAALPFLSGQVLELGCGTGNLQHALAPRASTVGMDASAQMLSLTRARLAHDKLPARLVRAFAQALPFQPASFDSLVATFPSEYIADLATLAEVRRVLRPGGRFVIVMAAAFAHHRLYERLVDLAYRLTLQRSPRADTSYPPESVLGARLMQAGFSVVERWEPVDGDRVHVVFGTRN
jgi:ubiquinone/menaquinone biosynthesis C-methylase UbiE